MSGTTTTVTPDAVAIQTATAAAVAGLTRETLASGNPGLFATLQAEFTAAGATAERDRIKAVREQTMKGHEALIETLAFDGKTTGPEAAMQVLGAHKASLAKTAAAHFNDASPAAPGSSSAAAPENQGGAKSRADKNNEALAYAKEHGVEFAVAWKKLGFDA